MSFGWILEFGRDPDAVAWLTKQIPRRHGDDFSSSTADSAASQVGYEIIIACAGGAAWLEC